MSSAARSILVFGVYVVGFGAMILAAPNVLFAGPPIEKVCLLVLGTTVLIVGGYYICCARHEAVAFFRATVYGRAVVLAFFIAFVALGWARPILVLFGAVDFAGAVWTPLALRRDASRAAAPAGAWVVVVAFLANTTIELTALRATAHSQR